MKVVLEIPFVSFSNRDIEFAKKELVSRNYIKTKAVSTPEGWNSSIKKSLLKQYLTGMLRFSYYT